MAGIMHRLHAAQIMSGPGLIHVQPYSLGSQSACCGAGYDILHGIACVSHLSNVSMTVVTGFSCLHAAGDICSEEGSQGPHSDLECDADDMGAAGGGQCEKSTLSWTFSCCWSARWVLLAQLVAAGRCGAVQRSLLPANTTGAVIARIGLHVVCFPLHAVVGLAQSHSRDITVALHANVGPATGHASFTPLSPIQRPRRTDSRTCTDSCHRHLH